MKNILTAIDGYKAKQKSCPIRCRMLRGKATESELCFQKKLDALHVKYMFQKGFIAGHYAIVDFYLPKPHKLCIEIDGDYHSSKQQAEKDRIRDDYLINKRGFRVVRLTDATALNITLSELSKIIWAPNA